MFIILNWYAKDSVFVINDPETLATMDFTTEEEALEYAARELNGMTKVVEIED